jgi:hypothetical protein
VIWPGPIPIYYPYPVTYAGARYYNTATGAWARGGAIYGPWYGARGGSAYNPQTGAWARGGSVYGPYGGAGAFSAYNPTTGSYAHGSAVYGPDGASANADWYNARTGISGSTNQNSNAYGHWGSSTISGPDQTVHTQTQGDSRGTVGSFTSSSGAEGAGARGAGGNSGGAVKTSGGDVYAGADGKVYKKTSDGWEKYDGGSWNPVEKPDTSQRTSEARPAIGDKPAQRTSEGGQTSKTTASRAASSPETAPAAPANRTTSAARTGPFARGQAGTAAPAGLARPGGVTTSSQLNHDFQARQGGAQRQQFQGAARGGSRGGFRN